MVSHEHRGFGRHIIVAVLQLVSRCRPLRIDAPLLGKPFSVENVAKRQHSDSNYKNYDCIHFLMSSFESYDFNISFINFALPRPIRLVMTLFPSRIRAAVWTFIHPYHEKRKLL